MKTNPNVCFVDTGAFIALHHASDNNHRRALELAKRLTWFRFAVTDAVLTETYSLLRYRLGFHTANRFLDIVLSNSEYELVDVTKSMRLDAQRLLQTYDDHKISYCDALSVVAMKQKKIGEIFAFDYHFELMGVSLIQHRLS